MRFVPVNCIQNGMISAKQLVGKNGELLLNKGATIYESYIDTIKELGYNGIYIDDNLSRDIEIMDVINPEIRMKTVSSIKNIFNLESVKVADQKIKEFKETVTKIVDEIMYNQQVMINMIDLKVFDDYTFYHSVNVGILSTVIGTAIGLNKSQLHNLCLAGMLHDIGKVFIPKDILNKPGKLTTEEYEVIKAHSFKGYEYLKTMSNVPITSYIGVLSHHEKYDGNGYPHGRKGSKISLFGRIIAIADVYDALTSKRPYREAMIPSEAAEFIMGSSNSTFDADLVNVFVRKVAIYPVGSYVLLNDGRSGIVTENYSDFCMRPKIKVVKHKDQEVEPYYVDLKSDRSTMNITIVGMSNI